VILTGGCLPFAALLERASQNRQHRPILFASHLFFNGDLRFHVQDPDRQRRSCLQFHRVQEQVRIRTAITNGAEQIQGAQPGEKKLVSRRAQMRRVWPQPEIGLGTVDRVKLC